jgi:hypothetical protein
MKCIRVRNGKNSFRKAAFIIYACARMYIFSVKMVRNNNSNNGKNIYKMYNRAPDRPSTNERVQERLQLLRLHGVCAILRQSKTPNQINNYCMKKKVVVVNYN